MRIYLVGGYVRDLYLTRELGYPQGKGDRDWVVVGATAREMIEQGFKQVGKDFPVFLHPKTHEEYALARTERKVAPGYHGFVFNTSSEVSLEEDLKRRDLTINAMAEEAKRNFVEAVALLHGFSDERYKLVEDLEKSVDRYEDKLGTYLVKVTEREMTVRQNAEVSKFLHTLSDFERISDHALNIAEGAKELHEKNLSFSDAAAHELEVVEAALTEILSTAIRSFVNNDLQLAARVEPLEELIDNLCDELKLHHVDRLQKGLCTLGQGFVFNDLLTNYERVADHCSNIAVAMIELESDSFDTHEYLNSVKEMKSDTFARYYEEYSRIYQI